MEGKVLYFDKKRGNDLSVIAQRTRLGNITEASLNNSVARFKRFVNEYKQKTKFLIPARLLLIPKAIFTSVLPSGKR